MEHSTVAELEYSFTCPNKFLKALGSIDFDLCFLDIVMPEINGLELSQRINNKPFIFFPAYAKN